jgi:hypothetical protein
MKEYQAPQIEVTVFEVKDIVTIDFSSFNLGEWDKNKNFTGDFDA